MPRDGAILRICLIAGEMSGDLLGARLMQAIAAQAKVTVQFIGVGGPQMESAGLQSIFPMQELSVMGIAEVLPRLPRILGRIRQTARFIEAERPDVVVTIDSPDFCFRVAKLVKSRVKQPPVMIHYVAPTVWAWRPERAAKVARLYDGMICLYPFEPPYFEKEGMAAVFAGHPLIESDLGHADGKLLRKELGIAEGTPVLGVLFGSRMGELNRVGPVLREAAKIVASGKKDMHILTLTLPHLEKQVVNLLQGIPCKTHVVTDQGRKSACFAAIDIAMATSGTVGLELAMAGVPHLIAYKMNALTWQTVRRKVSVKYAHMVNILLDRPAVPEFIQNSCRAEPIAAMAEKLLAGNAAGQRESFSQAQTMLAAKSGDSPSAVAARFVLDSAYLRFPIGT